MDSRLDFKDLRRDLGYTLTDLRLALDLKEVTWGSLKTCSETVVA